MRYNFCYIVLHVPVTFFRSVPILLAHRFTIFQAGNAAPTLEYRLKEKKEDNKYKGTFRKNAYRYKIDITLFIKKIFNFCFKFMNMLEVPSFAP